MVLNIISHNSDSAVIEFIFAWTHMACTTNNNIK